ncbi:MAG: hypothetical protein ACQEQU_01560 [Spirochaetota bacterium]
MVKGIDVFRDHFKGFEDRYVLIGGTASSIVMEEAGAAFRATKDLDIVLCIETLDFDFVQKFWEFVENGEYSSRQKSTGKKLFYRFHSPQNKSFPYMLELFSRIPDSLETSAKNSQLTPIPVEEDISSLSAILLDSAYYHLIYQNIKVIENLPVIGPEVLIPLKAKAWLDLIERKTLGNTIDSKVIRKHRNDVFRLFQLLPENHSISFPKEIQEDLRQFTDGIVSDTGINLKSLGIRTQSLHGVISRLKEFYRI